MEMDVPNFHKHAIDNSRTSQKGTLNNPILGSNEGRYTLMFNILKV